MGVLTRDVCEHGRQPQLSLHQFTALVSTVVGHRLRQCKEYIEGLFKYTLWQWYLWVLATQKLVKCQPKLDKSRVYSLLACDVMSCIRIVFISYILLGKNLNFELKNGFNYRLFPLKKKGKQSRYRPGVAQRVPGS